MQRETNFWGRIVSGIWGARRVLNRIENGVLDGMPDTYYCIDGTGGWMELKAPVEPKRATTPLFSGNHPLSLAQRNWLLAHAQAGGVSWVAIESDTAVLLVEGRHADIVNGSTLEELKRLAAFWSPRPMAEPDWRKFAETLVGKRRNK